MDLNKRLKKGSLVNLKKIVIYLSGPIFNLVVAFVFIFVNPIMTELIYVNMILFLINLIPIFPLDGGRIFKEFVHIFFGYKSSLIWIQRVSEAFIFIILFFSSCLILYEKNISIFIFSVALFLLQTEENRKIESRIKQIKIVERIKADF